MTQLIRRRLSAEEKGEIWQRWKKGESLAAISRALSRTPPPIGQLVCRAGGIAPALRRRRPDALTLADRENISRGIAAQKSIRAIARAIGRPPSTVSRELNRNGKKDAYRAVQADQEAFVRARRPKHCKLKLNSRLRDIVARKLSNDWSPQQIAGWLKRQFGGSRSYQVSHETIYRSLYIQARGVLKAELHKHLRQRRRYRKPNGIQSERRGAIPDLVSISVRPPEAEDRALPGHWEGDLIEGTCSSCIATLVERSTRYVALVKVNSKKTSEVVEKLTRQAKDIPQELYKSLTWDRGAELKQHKRFSLATGVEVYFCDPQSPWQRGSNENTNGLLRQYFPKGTNLSVHSQAHLNKIARKLNERPRKTLDFETPADRFAACVALTG